MMLKIRKRNYKLLGIITCSLLLSVSYFGLSFYSIPEKANAVIWAPTKGPGIKDIASMQEMTPVVCHDSEVGDSKTLTDTRDDNTYIVKKLSDGKCWMTQNLRLTRASIQAKTPENTTGLLTPEDSNVSANYSLPAAITTAFDPTVTNGTYTNEQVRAAANNIYGAYYSWCAATAKTCMIDETTPVPAGDNATSSICPKGWRLPTGGTNGDFYELYHTGSSKVGNSSNWVAGDTTSGYNFGSGLGIAFFPAAGYINNSNAPGGTGTYGGYWSSTTNSLTQANYLHFTSEIVYPGHTSNRYAGFSVRCVSSATPDSHTESNTGDITVMVAKMLTLDATTNMTKTVDITEVMTGEISATVSANTAYQVLLSAEEPNLTSASSANTAVISASPDVRAGVTNAWGILDHDGESYDAITTDHVQYHDEKENLGNGSVKHIYTIGISISPTLPADTYSTSVTITVAAI